jgi:4-diphosphocytidyl-2-C-methyl-D-erythritol kinase
MITAISERAKLVSKSSHDPIEKLDYHGAESHIAAHLYNDLERVVLPAYPQISEIKEKLLQFVGNGCLGAMMSGSGATVFGIAENLDAAEKIAHSIRSDTVRVWVTQTTNRAIEEEVI